VSDEVILVTGAGGFIGGHLVEVFGLPTAAVYDVGGRQKQKLHVEP